MWHTLNRFGSSLVVGVQIVGLCEFVDLLDNNDNLRGEWLKPKCLIRNDGNLNAGVSLINSLPTCTIAVS